MSGAGKNIYKFGKYSFAGSSKHKYKVTFEGIDGSSFRLANKEIKYSEWDIMLDYPSADMKCASRYLATFATLGIAAAFLKSNYYFKIKINIKRMTDRQLRDIKGYVKIFRQKVTLQQILDKLEYHGYSISRCDRGFSQRFSGAMLYIRMTHKDSEKLNLI